MQEPTERGAFETIAMELIDRTQAVKDAPYLSRMAMIGELAEDMPCVVLGMAKELDRLVALHPANDGGPASPSNALEPANINAPPMNGAGEAAA